VHAVFTLALLVANVTGQAPAQVDSSVASPSASRSTSPFASYSNLEHPLPGLPPLPAHQGPAPTQGLFELGHRLFADPILSIDRTVSCQTCHQPELAFASREAFPRGVNGKVAAMHAPALVNRAYGTRMRWDGRTADLASFVLEPIADPNEMALPLPEALARLRADRDYGAAFAQEFADGVTQPNLATALSTFVRSIAAGDAPVDRFQKGDPTALTKEQRAGLWVFESKGACWRCHPAPLFTDGAFHTTGIGAVDRTPHPGRMTVTKDPADEGRFKTPQLRGLRLSAPYMHDGSLPTLEAVVEFYARGGNPSHNLDPNLKPLSLTEDDKRNLIAFLSSL
jgi:cytochrome c peroxidase